MDRPVIKVSCFASWTIWGIACRVGLIAGCLFLLAGFLSPVLAASGKKHVLVLHSYHKGFKWTDDITRGIEEVFADSRMPVDVQFEYMDTKKIFDEVYQRQVTDLYRYKFRNQTFDAIVASDDNAFNFLRDYRDQLFPGVPVIFCGTNYMTPDRAAELPNATGVNEAASLKENLDLILSVHPSVTHLAIIADGTTTGRRISRRLTELLPHYEDRVTVELLQDLSMTELEQKLRGLPDGAVVLYTVFFRDRENRFFEFDDSIDRVTAASGAPVYITWDFSLGHGAVGGLLTSGWAQGEAAAELTLRVLAGEEAESIPFIRESPNVYLFDYDVLQKFGIERRFLPAKATILNQPDELYQRYRELIWKSAVAAVVLVAIIVLLATNILRRRRAEALLTQANEDLENRVRLRTKDVMLTNNRLNEEIREHRRVARELIKMKRGVDQSLSSVVILNKNLKIEYVNPRFTQITGYEADEVLGKKLFFLKGDQWSTDYDAKRTALRAGREWRGEFRNKRKDGTLYYETAAMSPIFDEEGTLTHYLSINDDITEKKKADEALAEALDEAIELSQKLEQSNQDMQGKNTELEEAYQQLKATQSQMLQQEKMASIGQLAAGVAHEINNPIGFITGNLRALGKYVHRLGDFFGEVRQSLEETPEVPEALRRQVRDKAKSAKIDYILEDTGDLVEESLEGAERVREIVQGLKTFSRVDQAERNAVDLNECLDSTINIVWNELKYKATLEKDYGELPPVDCYPQQLNQVFMNILVNAAQAIPSQGTIAIRTRAEADDRVTITISDTGCGIAEDKLGRIFEPFFTTKDVGKGTGLGMSIAYDIVQKHGGEIRVESTVGEGTTFVVDLPVALKENGTGEDS